MTTGRLTLTGLAVLATALGLGAPGCGDSAAPCTDCPAMEGRYRMAFGDAGVPAECLNLGVELPRNRPLDVTRSADRLIGNLEGVGLLGTISAEGSFSMAGTGPGQDGGRMDTLSLAGRYTSPEGDGGTARLDGTFTGNFSRPGVEPPQRCSFVTPFSATRE
ncbi:hypothetical protein OWM54_00925 [Myxococcus sp. MISCRS1]|uniref:hypothetical protein n=1 Tax=Myxococcus TaxID=32 RepID=UPI001CBDF658|nr:MULTISPECIES: hypothetical protein [Myxococcus]MCK8502262.1 hypothetical protein [Myxococcus fulvus]MCY0995690.1 hypothetical protein [Myxococcus sp. MISCRS1]BDT34324.1 hypothetical protein MFMH1_39930 [Myxococcus sp. MH1]